LRAFTSDCASVRKAATEYLGSRGFALTEEAKSPFAGHRLYNLNVTQLLDESGRPISWPAVREKYFWPDQNGVPFDEKRVRRRSAVHWETAAKWKMFGFIELETNPSGCVARVDFSYARLIRQYLIFLPIDEYGEGLMSNNRLEDESIEALDRILSAR
jgi:hypothetical protein